MISLWHFLINATVGYLAAAMAFLAVNLVLLLSGRGNRHHLRFARTVRRALRDGPPDAVFNCRKGVVSALIYDRASDTESSVTLYQTNHLSPLRWYRGSRSAKELRRRADAAFALSVGCLLLVFIPLLAIGSWLAVNVSWLWALAVTVLVANQICGSLAKRDFFLRYGICHEMALIIILHRWHLYSLSTMYILTTALLVLCMSVWPFVDIDD